MHNNNKRRNTMNGGGGNGQHRHHNNNNRPRRFNNNRPQHEGGSDPASVTRTRRNATQNREKYQMMARDAMASGDRVLNEYYLQHADHYHRVILALPPEEAPRPQYLRGHGPNGEGEQANGQQHQDTGQPSNTAHHSEHHQTDHHQNEHETMPSSGHALPSFITQPVNPEEPRE